jgi:hypothetical protein
MTPPGMTASDTARLRPPMQPDLGARTPGASLPEAARVAAARTGRRTGRLDPELLRRVWEALARLPDSALNRRYFEIPGDCLASPADTKRHEWSPPGADRRFSPTGTSG